MCRLLQERIFSGLRWPLSLLWWCGHGASMDCTPCFLWLKLKLDGYRFFFKRASRNCDQICSQFFSLSFLHFIQHLPVGRGKARRAKRPTHQAPVPPAHRTAITHHHALYRPQAQKDNPPSPPKKSNLLLFWVMENRIFACSYYEQTNLANF